VEYTQEIRILYSDTDSYGVVWHGAYTKWFEAARVGLVEELGLPLAELEENGTVFPVVEMNIRYKSSARMNERIVIKTNITEVKPLSVTFEHKVYEIFNEREYERITVDREDYSIDVCYNDVV
jgi:acyl-CoA thioester hydrolase